MKKVHLHAQFGRRYLTRHDMHVYKQKIMKASLRSNIEYLELFFKYKLITRFLSNYSTILEYLSAYYLFKMAKVSNEYLKSSKLSQLKLLKIDGRE